jgi:hypothetical protein
MFSSWVKLLFFQLGRIPRRIRIDNLIPAVMKVRSITEEARFTDAFM